jgi:hypothetical protein
MSLRCLAAALVASLALAACGDDDRSTGSEDRARIADVMLAALASDDPSTCTELQTQRFTAQSTRRTGDAAVAQCERNADDRADSVKVSKVDISGRGATAEGTLTGGFLDGQTIQVALVKDDDQWKLDELTGFAEIDSKALATSLRELLASNQRISPEALDCITKEIEKAPEQQLQDLLLATEERSGLLDACVQFFRQG